jgi:hypothetical protein
MICAAPKSLIGWQELTPSVDDSSSSVSQSDKPNSLRCLLIELKDDDAGVFAFKFRLLHRILCGGCEHRISAQHFRRTNTTRGGELKLKANNSGDFHAASEIRIHSSDFSAPTLAGGRFFREECSREEHGRKNEASLAAISQRESVPCFHHYGAQRSNIR